MKQRLLFRQKILNILTEQGFSPQYLKPKNNSKKPFQRFYDQTLAELN
jgi:hypothetical protein